MIEFLDRVPSLDQFYELNDGEIETFLLEAMVERFRATDPLRSKHVSVGELFDMYLTTSSQPQWWVHKQRVSSRMSEVWQQLQTGGWITQAPDQVTGVMVPTSKALKMSGTTGFGEQRERSLLRPEMLHEKLRGRNVYGTYVQGDLETAVNEAFVILETSIRDAAAPGSHLVGTKLIDAAFEPLKGTLVDASSPAPHQARLWELFKGSLGTFRNPLAHRRTASLAIAEAREELMLASRLLRLLDK